METDPEQQKFEAVYPRHEFAPLVSFALTAGRWIRDGIEKKPRALTSVTPPRRFVP